MRIKTFLLLLLLWSGNSYCADFYFSNCAVGGAGTEVDPYCLDPASTGAKNSFEYLMNGSAPEAACGDTIYLCAGSCDGSGTGTFNLSGHASPGQNSGFTAVSPHISCVEGNQMTIQVYPGETVIISGDTNGNGVFDSGDPQNFLRVTDTTKQFYHWIGDPQGTGIPHLIFERFGGGSMFLLTNNATGWLFNGIEIRFNGAEMWNGGNRIDNCTQANDHGIRSDGLQGHLEVRNSRIHSLCGFAQRNQGTQTSTASMLFENNEYYNLILAGDGFNGYNHTWRGNYIHDCDAGIGIEDRMRNVIVEDNTIACLGEYKVRSDFSCRRGISVVPDSEALDGGLVNVTLRRNKIYGNATGNPSTANPGVMQAGIMFWSDNDTTSPVWIIENNMIWNIFSNFACRSTSPATAPITVQANKPVIVRNNTVYKSKCGIELNTDTVTPVSVSHVMENNLVTLATGGEEVFIFSSAAGSVLRNNNLWDFGAGGDVLVFQSGGTNRTCATIGSHGNGSNICSSFKFVKCDDATGCNTINADETTWDLHLLATDTVNKDVGTSGASDDIDKQTRPQGAGTDIGADEIAGEVVTGPKSKMSGRAQISGQVKVQ